MPSARPLSAQLAKEDSGGMSLDAEPLASYALTCPDHSSAGEDMFLCSMRGFRATLVEISRHLLLARSVLRERILVIVVDVACVSLLLAAWWSGYLFAPRRKDDRCRFRSSALFETVDLPLDVQRRSLGRMIRS